MISSLWSLLSLSSFARAAAWLFGCPHPRATWPRARRDRYGRRYDVRVCLDCGAETPCATLRPLPTNFRPPVREIGGHFEEGIL